MSLIYKSLKKLKAQSAKTEKAKRPEAGNVYTFRKLLFSPQTFILIFLLILTMGFVTIQGYHFIRNTFFVKKQTIENNISDKNTKAEPVNNGTSSIDTPVGPMMNEEGIPPAPETIPVTNATPRKLTLPSAAMKTSIQSGKKTNTGSSLTPGDLPEQSFTARFPPPRQYSESKYLQQQPDKASNPTPESAAKVVSQAEKQHLEKIDRQSKITRLVSKIEKSLRGQNLEQTETLLKKLTAVKGEQNSYVLKLKAYLLILKRDFREAENILEKILSGNSSDLNAGINMAVIEAGTGRLSSAQDRLKRLSKLFPENAEIDELMERLQ